MDINELRKLVRQRHDAATGKISRLRQKGVEVGGSSLDPRTDPAKYKRYTRSQLEGQLRKLNGFVDRRNSFVALSEGKIAPGELWRQYTREESKYNAKGRQRDKPLENIKHPGAGDNDAYTLANRNAMMKPNQIRAGGEASNKPYAPVKRKPSDIAGVEELQKLIEHYRRKNSREYLPEYLKGQRKQAEQMMNKIGVGDQIEDLRALTDDQFDTLFNDTDFAGDLGMRYGYMAMLGKGKKNEAHDSVMETNERDISAQISWAKSLPPRVRSKGK